MSLRLPGKAWKQEYIIFIIIIIIIICVADIASLLLDDCIGDGGKTITFNYKFLEERAHHHTDFPNDIDAERYSTV